MDEQQGKEHLERLESRAKELLADRAKALEVLEVAGICDSAGNLTDLYR